MEGVNQYTFLGLWFDERITWAVHVKKVVNRCKKQTLSVKFKGLKAIYTLLVRSDYGCVVFRSAASTTQKKIYNIQYQALRVCTGATKTTPTAILQVEMGEMPLELRSVPLSLNYWINLRGHSQDLPAQSTLKPCWEKERRETKSFG